MADELGYQGAFALILPQHRGEGERARDAAREVRDLPAGIVNLAARGMLVVSVAQRLGSEGPLLADCAARSNRAGSQKGSWSWR